MTNNSQGDEKSRSAPMYQTKDIINWFENGLQSIEILIHEAETKLAFLRGQREELLTQILQFKSNLPPHSAAIPRIGA